MTSDNAAITMSCRNASRARWEFGKIDTTEQAVGGFAGLL